MPKFYSYTKGDRTTHELSIRTRFLSPFTELASLIYPNKIKIVSQNIYDLLTPVGLAY